MRLTVPAYASPAPLGYPIRYSLCLGFRLLLILFLDFLSPSGIRRFDSC